MVYTIYTQMTHKYTQYKIYKDRIKEGGGGGGRPEKNLGSARYTSRSEGSFSLKFSSHNNPKLF